MGQASRAPRSAARPAGGAGRPAYRAPVRLPPRIALAGRTGGRARGRLGGRAAARPDADQRRPRLAPTRRAKAARAGRAASLLLRGARQPRPGGYARPVRAALPFAGARCGDAARGRLADGRAPWAAGADRRRRPADVRGRARAPRRARPTDSADLRILLCHFPGGDRQAEAGLIRPRARRTPARGPDLRAVPRRTAAPRAPALALHPGCCTSGRPGRCTSRPASARRSFRSASSPSGGDRAPRAWPGRTVRGVTIQRRSRGGPCAEGSSSGGLAKARAGCHGSGV